MIGLKMTLGALALPPNESPSSSRIAQHQLLLKIDPIRRIRRNRRLASGLAQKLEQLGALGMREHIVQAAPVGPSQKLTHNEGNRRLQLAEQLGGLALNAKPVDGPAALFFHEDLTEPKLKLFDLHERQCA
jgi:hypothetical protein